jgi:hypothetical protein
MVVIIALLGITLIPACQETAIEDDDPSAQRKVRLLEYENGILKKDIEDLKADHAKELDKQTKLLEKCNKDKKELQGGVQKNAEQLINQLLAPMVQENEGLRNENAELKQLIDQLKQK